MEHERLTIRIDLTKISQGIRDGSLKTYKTKKGENFLTLYCNPRKEESFGETHYITAGKDKGGNTLFVGSAKPSPEGKNKPMAEKNSDDNEDLPF